MRNSIDPPETLYYSRNSGESQSKHALKPLESPRWVGFSAIDYSDRSSPPSVAQRPMESEGPTSGPGALDSALLAGDSGPFAATFGRAFDTTDRGLAPLNLIYCHRREFVHGVVQTNRWDVRSANSRRPP